MRRRALESLARGRLQQQNQKKVIVPLDQESSSGKTKLQTKFLRGPINLLYSFTRDLSTSLPDKLATIYPPRMAGY